MATSKVTIIIESDETIETIEIFQAEHEHFDELWTQPREVQTKGGLDTIGPLELGQVVFSCQPQLDTETNSYIRRSSEPKSHGEEGNS